MSSYKYSVYNSAKHSRRRPGGGGGGRGRGGASRHGEYINPARFVQAAKPRTEENAYQSKHTFEDFEIHNLLKQNLRSKNFTVPTPIQDQTIPLALDGNDIIGIANTGTGKTAAFALPILNTLMERQQSKALIVAPTRELAQQIEDECRSLGRGSHLSGALLIGGSSMSTQLRALRNRPRIVIGTPGRIKDHIERGTLKLEQFNLLVLDEVDRMLDMGFINDVTTILNKLSNDRQSFFFSATIDSRVQGLIKNFTHDPKTVSVKTGDTAEYVNQDVVKYIGIGDKMDKLHDILIRDEVSKVIVFDETQRNVEKLSNELVARGFSSDAIHGGKSQGQRQRALDSFKADKTKILVATDVAARGIDVADVSHVINYTQPHTYQDYVHRIGRAGRAGKTGHALTFVN